MFEVHESLDEEDTQVISRRAAESREQPSPSSLQSCVGGHRNPGSRGV